MFSVTFKSFFERKILIDPVINNEWFADVDLSIKIYLSLIDVNVKNKIICHRHSSSNCVLRSVINDQFVVSCFFLKTLKFFFFLFYFFFWNVFFLFNFLRTLVSKGNCSVRGTATRTGGVLWICALPENNKTKK